MSDNDQNDIAEFGQPCPIRDVLNQIGDQWSLLILEALAERNRCRNLFSGRMKTMLISAAPADASMNSSRNRRAAKTVTG